MIANMTGALCYGLDVLLPGPDRKRTTKPYHYHLTYRRADQHAPGCLMTWEVHGGRSSYQVAVERAEQGNLHLHCTCADAIYRGEEPGHRCKHIEGFLQAGELLNTAEVTWRVSA